MLIREKNTILLALIMIFLPATILTLLNMVTLILLVEAEQIFLTSSKLFSAHQGLAGEEISLAALI